MLVNEKVTIKEASRRLNINYWAAKNVYTSYRRHGIVETVTERKRRMKYSALGEIGLRMKNNSSSLAAPLEKAKLRPEKRSDTARERTRSLSGEQAEPKLAPTNVEYCTCADAAPLVTLISPSPLLLIAGQPVLL